MSNKEFESSDNVRTATPLRHLQTVTFSEPFQLELGAVLPCVTAAYETYGKLNATKDNAIIVSHAFSGDSHVAQHDDRTTRAGGISWSARASRLIRTVFLSSAPTCWADAAARRAPAAINPATGKPLRARFSDDHHWGHGQACSIGSPNILAFPSSLAVVGGSVGGHQALTWAELFPDASGRLWRRRPRPA